MALGEFGAHSSPEIDRESDLLREIERLRAALEAIAELGDPGFDTSALIAQQALNRK